MGERVSIVVISTITYTCHFVYRAICHFTGKILGPGGGLSDRNSKPFPFQLPFPLSLILSLYPHRSSLFQRLFQRLFISFPPFHAVVNVPPFLSIAILVFRSFSRPVAVFPYPRPAHTPIYLPVMDIIK